MIRYRAGYKYQLINDYRCQTQVFPGIDIVTEYIELERDGILTIRHMYAWDGASWPAIDTKNFMRGSLVHDAFAQLLRDGYLDSSFFKPVNKELRKIVLEDGMWKIRAWWVYIGVQYISNGAWAKPGGERHFKEAP